MSNKPDGPIRESQLAPLDRLLCMYLRTLMKGLATKKTRLESADGEITVLHTAMTNMQVWQWWRICPCHVELRVRRLQLLQRCAKEPAWHAQFFAAVLGHARFETRPGGSGQLEECHATLLEDGRLAEGANPWAQQVEADLRALSTIEDGEALVKKLEIPGEKGLSVRAVFLPPLVEEFIGLDLGQLRAAYFSCRMSPDSEDSDSRSRSPSPGGLAAGGGDGTLGHGEDEFVCTLRGASGDVCGCTFKTRRSLLMHQRHAVGGEHGVGDKCLRLTVTNQCPLCSSTFVSRLVAQNHVRRAMEKGECAVDRSTTCIPAVPPFSFHPFQPY